MTTRPSMPKMCFSHYTLYCQFCKLSCSSSHRPHNPAEAHSLESVFHQHLSAKAHVDPCKWNPVLSWHIFYSPQLGHGASMAVLQGMTWHSIQVTRFLLVSHALRDAGSFWHQLIPHSALEITLALIFSPVFRSFQEAHTMLLLITQLSKLQFTDTNPIGFIFSAFLSLAFLLRPVQDVFKLCLILLYSNWKALISFKRSRMKPRLLTFFALRVSLELALE